MEDLSIEDLAPKTSPLNPLEKVEIHLIHSEKDAVLCPLWVGVYRKGNMSPEELLDYKKVEEILEAAVHEGLDSDEVVVLAETREERAPCKYFLVPIENEKVSESQRWLENLTAAISDWGEQSPGIYFSPELLGTELALKLLLMLMKHFIDQDKFTRINLLVGSHGMHSILNAALKLKVKLNEVSSKDVQIFH